MDVVGVAANFDDLATELVADAAKVIVQLGFYERVYAWCAVLGVEYDMDVIFND